MPLRSKTTEADDRTLSRSVKGVVVAPEPPAAEAAAQVLRNGGNAIDAAVTGAFVQCVVDPFQCGIGGCGVMLIYLAAERRNVVIEFYALAGALTREDQWSARFVRQADDRYGFILDDQSNDIGYRSIAVPGTVRGLHEALWRFGTLRWADVLEPAVALARSGVVVWRNVANAFDTSLDRGLMTLASRLAATREAERVYAPHGRPLRVGEILNQDDLARTLERLSEAGADDFYAGRLSELIVRDLSANGAAITASDLERYQPVIRTPLSSLYRDYRVASVGPPAGGLSLLQMLNFLEGFDMSAFGWPSTEAAHVMAQAMMWAFGDRDVYLGDPRFVPVPVDRLLDKTYAAEARSSAAQALTRVGSVVPSESGTTHMCVLDSAGNAVSLTHTLGNSSGVVTPGLGFLYNNYMKCFDPRTGSPNSLAAGKARTTMMAPTFVFDKAGDLWLAVGAPGGTRIVTGILQVLLNVIDHGMTPLASIDAARIDRQASELQVEGRIPQAVVGGLRSLGYDVIFRPDCYDGYFSAVQLIVAGKQPSGASDVRNGGGCVLVV